MDKQSLLRNSRTIFCFTRFDPAMAEQTCQTIQDVEREYGEQTDEVPLTFVLNSPGGDPFAAKQIATWLGDVREFYENGESAVKPRIFVRGAAISSAAIFLVYAKNWGLPVYVEPRTILLFHDLEVVPPDHTRREVLRRNLNEYDELFDEMLDFYFKFAHQQRSFEELRQEVKDGETVLSSETILARGLADEVVT